MSVISTDKIIYDALCLSSPAKTAFDLAEMADEKEIIFDSGLPVAVNYKIEGSLIFSSVISYTLGLPVSIKLTRDGDGAQFLKEIEYTDGSPTRVVYSEI